VAERLHHLGFGRCERYVGTGVLDQASQIGFGIAAEQPDRTHSVGADQIEQIGRGFRDAQQNGFDKRKAGHQVANGSHLPRREIGQPVCQPLLGFIRRGHQRPVDKPRSQNMPVRFALSG
jgi:hypothetical protein